MNFNVYAIYQRLSKLPFGNRLFTRLVTLYTPYFTSIHPLIAALRPGYCRVIVKERRSIRNHIGTIHAIAMCNIAELVMGMVAIISLDPALRWIPRGMRVQYLKKAKGTLTGVCDIDPKILKQGDIDMPVVVTDESGDVVFKAWVTLFISGKKG